jgi:nanoRNase/pAp phosphatase (c-di-AMP/oligoRNAs hydrolase)
MSLKDQLAKLEKILVNVNGEVTVTSHTNCDPDGVACSFLVAELIRKIGVPAKVCFPEGVSKVTKRTLDKVGINWEKECPAESKTFVLCDFSNPLLLQHLRNRLLQPESQLIIIDHHFPPGLLVEKAVLTFLENEPASTIIATKLLMERKAKISGSLASLAIAGILFDTKRLQYATIGTFQALSWLLSMNGDYRLAYDSISEEVVDRSEKIARLKGLLRSSVIDVCGYIVAYTEVSANEASVSRLLISAGADIAIAVGGKKELRASMRVSDELQRIGVDAGEIARIIAEKIGGEGGGHKGAAGINKAKIEKGEKQLILSETLNYVSRKLCSKT